MAVYKVPFVEVLPAFPLTDTGKIRKGEPTKSDVPPGAKGDCIDCYACVNVCPMGIDIRDGRIAAIYIVRNPDKLTCVAAVV